MFRSLAMLLAAALLVSVVACNTNQAGEHNKVLSIGDPAPSWSDLPGTDGEQHSTADLKQSKAIAVVFTCNKCPVAVAYEDRLIALANDYQDKGVAVVAINVNKTENLDEMKTRAEEKEFPFAYIFDDSQQIAKDYGATNTPHVFLVGKDSKIAYMGAIDDNQKTDKVTENWLRDAIDAVLAGNAPEKPETRQFGCSIKWK